MSFWEGTLEQNPPSESLGDANDTRLRKVRTGCSMARKIKCDEQRPSCQKCVIGKRKCPGYATPPPPKPAVRRSKYDIGFNEPGPARPETSSKIENASSEFSTDAFTTKLLLPAVPRAMDSIGDANEARGIHFFQLHASLDVSAYFEGEFWQCSLQASQSESIIRHALLAISSLYEAQEFTEPASEHSRSLTRFALQQYTKAVSLLSSNIGGTTTSPQVVLISCLIFIWLEFLHDNLDVALGHLRSGIRILADQPQMSQCRDPDGFLFHSFTRLHTQAALHGSPSSDFDPNETFVAAGEHLGEVLKFSKIREARSSLDSKLNKVFRFHRMIEQPGYIQRCLEEGSLHRIEGWCQSHLDSLQAWKIAYDELKQRLSRSATRGDSQCLYELELQYLVTANTLTTLFSTTPMIYDAYDAEFAQVVSLCKEIIRQRRPQRRLLALPFDTGVLAPLYYVLLKCRTLTIRSAAMELVRECPEREGMWDRATIIEFAEWKIAKEEHGRALLGVARKDPLPEEARIYCEKPRAAVVDGRSVTVVSYKRGAYGGIADVEPDEEEVTALSMRLAAVLGT